MTVGAFFEAQEPHLRGRMERALRAGQVSLANLIIFDFTTGILRFCDRTVDVVDGGEGHTWKPLLQYIRFDDISYGPENLAPLRIYSLTIPRSLSERFKGQAGPLPQLDEKTTYQGRECTYLQQLLETGAGPDGTDAPLGRPYVLHRGRMDKITSRMTSEGIRHEMRVEGLLTRSKVAGAAVLTPRDQKARHPTDLGVDYVPEITIREPEWPKF